MQMGNMPRQEISELDLGLGVQAPHGGPHRVHVDVLPEVLRRWDRPLLCLLHRLVHLLLHRLPQTAAVHQPPQLASDAMHQHMIYAAHHTLPTSQRSSNAISANWAHSLIPETTHPAHGGLSRVCGPCLFDTANACRGAAQQAIAISARTFSIFLSSALSTSSWSSSSLRTCSTGSRCVRMLLISSRVRYLRAQFPV